MHRKESHLHKTLKKPFKMLVDRFDNIKEEKDTFKITCLTKNCEHIWHYNPDFCLTYKKPKHVDNLIIFEIVDTQTPEKTVYDILRIKFLGNCRKAIFICDKKTKLDMVNKAICITTSRLRKMTGEKSKKDVVDIEPYFIPPEATNDDIFRGLATIISELIRLKPKKEYMPILKRETAEFQSKFLLTS